MRVRDSTPTFFEKGPGTKLRNESADKVHGSQGWVDSLETSFNEYIDRHVYT